MSPDPNASHAADWRAALPTLLGRSVTLREPTAHDIGSLVDILSLVDATRFGIDEADHGTGRTATDRSRRSRAGRRVVVHLRDHDAAAGRLVVGLVQVRQLDPAFEAAEWECTIVAVVRAAPACSSRRRGWSDRLRSARSARIGSKRACCCRTAARNGALRKLGAVQEGVLRRSVRRGGEYVDQVLWSLLKEDWGDHWVSTAPAGPLTQRCPARGARLRRAGHRRGRGAAARRACRSRASTSRSLFLALLVLLVGDGGAQGAASAHDERLDDVGLVRGGLRVAAAARSARDDARRGGQRVQPVPSEQQGAQPALSHAVQHGVARHHRAGRRPRVPSARRARAVGDAAHRRSRVRSSARRRCTSC